jgi:hypothetical protein
MMLSFHSNISSSNSSSSSQRQCTHAVPSTSIINKSVDRQTGISSMHASAAACMSLLHTMHKCARQWKSEAVLQLEMCTRTRDTQREILRSFEGSSGDHRYDYVCVRVGSIMHVYSERNAHDSVLVQPG